VPFSEFRKRFWCDGYIFPTLLMNAFTIYTSIIERYMLRQVRPLLGRITDPVLKQKVEAFILQEGVHSREHDQSLEFLENTGFKTAGIYRALEYFIDRVIDPLGRISARYFTEIFPLACVAGAEHWTAVIAETNLRYKRFEQIENSPMLWLFAWHGAEEIEHRSVVYDLMKHLECSYFTRISAFIVVSFVFALINIYAVSALFLQLRLREMLNPQLWFGAIFYLFLGPRVVIYSTLAFFEYLKPSHHPSDRAIDYLMEKGLRVASRGEEFGLTMSDLMLKSKAQ